MAKEQSELLHRIARAIIFNKQGAILLGKREHGMYKGYWELPGGKVDRHHGRLENPKKTIKRELQEETGLEFKPILYRSYFDGSLHPENPREVFVFVGAAKGELCPDPKEVSALRYFSLIPEEEESDITPYIKRLSRLKLAFDHRGILSDYYQDVRGGVYRPISELTARKTKA